MQQLSKTTIARSLFFAPRLSRCFGGAPEKVEKLQRTALHGAHIKLGGKLVPFAGYELPVQYPDGVVNNHLHVRASAGLFDVSHMGQLKIWGTDRVSVMEQLVVADIAALKNGQSTLSVITTENGGIIDDCIVTKRNDHLGLVVNGACKHKDMDHFKAYMDRIKKNVRIEYLENQALMAIQGPKAAEVLARVIQPQNSIDIAKWPFMHEQQFKIGKYNASVSRSGYTGEDGFEISVANEDAEAVWFMLLEHKEVLPAGLGVRDSLRLEAGLCLYGHDLNDTITPIEAGLAWTISARRRTEGGFFGWKNIKEQIDKGVQKKRVGLMVTGAPAREGAEIKNEAGQTIGTVTSGTFSPSLKKPISMGYVNTASSKIGTKLKVEVRGKLQDAEITKMPFVPSRYHRVQ